MNILFLHGWHSAPGGVKPTSLAARGHAVLNPALPDDDFAAAVAIAQRAADEQSPDVVVGSSRGGAVALQLETLAPRVVLCPAWRRWGPFRPLPRGSVVLHSPGDEVIPFADSVELVRLSGLPEGTLQPVGADHRLADDASLEALHTACLAARRRVVGCDFGAPRTGREQMRKVTLVEAVRVGERHYAAEAAGRNSRWLRAPKPPGWALPELRESLAADASVHVAAFDFPVSIPVELLRDDEFARRLLGGPEARAFGTRAAWAREVARRLPLMHAGAAETFALDFAAFAGWRDRGYWLKRKTDAQTGGGAPLKTVPPNLFNMTLAGVALLEHLAGAGYSTLLLTAAPPAWPGQAACETYPRAVARALGFVGSYKAKAGECLAHCLGEFARRGFRLDIAADLRAALETYRSAGDDADGVDALLCLLGAVACAEGGALLVSGGAAAGVLAEEGGVVVPGGC